MDHTQHSTIVSFIWSIADDVLRDLYVRGKYRDVILPMTVIRRLDCLSEPTKDEVLKFKRQLDEAGVVNQDEALCTAFRMGFCNTSPFALRRLIELLNEQRQALIHRAVTRGLDPNVRLRPSGAEWMECVGFRPWISDAAEPKLAGDRLMSVPISVPPVAEQHLLIRHMNAETAALRATAGRTHGEITLLRECRTRLIAEVVTGKLDVRGVELLAMEEEEMLEGLDDEEIVEREEAEALEEGES